MVELADQVSGMLFDLTPEEQQKAMHEFVDDVHGILTGKYVVQFGKLLDYSGRTQRPN